MEMEMPWQNIKTKNGEILCIKQNMIKRMQTISGLKNNKPFFFFLFPLFTPNSVNPNMNFDPTNILCFTIKTQSKNKDQ